MLLSSRWIEERLLKDISVESSGRLCSSLLCWINELIFLIKMLLKVSLILWLMKIEWCRHSQLWCALVSLELICKLLMKSLEIWNWFRCWRLEIKEVLLCGSLVLFLFFFLFLVSFHSWWEFCMFKTNDSVCFYSFVSFHFILVNHLLVEWHQDSPRNLSSSKLRKLANVGR